MMSMVILAGLWKSMPIAKIEMKKKIGNKTEPSPHIFERKGERVEKTTRKHFA